MASSTVTAPPPATMGPLPRASFIIIFCLSITTAFGNTGMQSILPAIGRQIGMPDILIPAIFSLSALLWGFSSPYWAKRSDATGRKPMMIMGLLGFIGVDDLLRPRGVGGAAASGRRSW